MKRESVLHSLSRLVSLLVIFAAPLALHAAPEGTVGNARDARDVKGVVFGEQGNRLATIPILCWDKKPSPLSQPTFVQQAISDASGGFSLTGIPTGLKTLSCWAGGGDMYEQYQDDLPLPIHDGASSLVLTAKLKTIATLEGIITSSRGKPIPHALVEVTDASGTTISDRATDKGRILFKEVKAGEAKVRYAAEGYESKSGPLLLSSRATLSTTLKPASAPIGLLLLLPGILVLGLRAAIDLLWRQPTDGRRADEVDSAAAGRGPLDPNAWLILASLASWGAMFLVLWAWMGAMGIESLTFFDTSLSFSLFVPACGFLGALVFVIDLFQQEHPNVNAFREFAMRLVLAPYVAIVVVTFFGGTFTFIQLTSLEAQAALAFFSGFLVVLFVQGLTERGNDLLGQWRSESRYEPSEIARKFALDKEEDIKLRNANLKYLAQLQALPEADLKVLGRQTDLGEGFLVALQSRLRPEHLELRLGHETWGKLNNEGVRTVWDVALLTPQRLQQISATQHIDQAVLTKFYEECQDFVADLDDFMRPPRRVSSQARRLAAMKLVETT